AYQEASFVLDELMKIKADIESPSQHGLIIGRLQVLNMRFKLGINAFDSPGIVIDNKVQFINEATATITSTLKHRFENDEYMLEEKMSYKAEAEKSRWLRHCSLMKNIMLHLETGVPLEQMQLTEWADRDGKEYSVDQYLNRVQDTILATYDNTNLMIHGIRTAVENSSLDSINDYKWTNHLRTLDNIQDYINAGIANGNAKLNVEQICDALNDIANDLPDHLGNQLRATALFLDKGRDVSIIVRQNSQQMLDVISFLVQNSANNDAVDTYFIKHNVKIEEIQNLSELDQERQNTILKLINDPKVIASIVSNLESRSQLYNESNQKLQKLVEQEIPWMHTPLDFVLVL
ncbi:MAG: hypothetical protein AAF153_03235, partial [Pseudomonadota bacterium]